MYGNCVIGEFHLNLVPLDSDVMSMELPLSFKNCNLHGDQTSLFYAAHAIMQLQNLFGVIPRITGKGEASRAVASMLLQMRKEQSEPVTVAPQMDSIILIDRAADLITPLCSQVFIRRCRCRCHAATAPSAAHLPCTPTSEAPGVFSHQPGL